MADVAVAGGGLVGQIAALMLARRGHQILVVDSDPDPVDGTAEDDFFRWPRPGVPQGKHGHVFRGRVGRVLREEVPDVVDACWRMASPRRDSTSERASRTTLL